MSNAEEKSAGRDLALMRFLDGELSPEEAADIERLLADDETARDKRAGLLLVGDILRDAVDGDTRADGIADAVMARLDEAPSPDEVAPKVASAKPANDNAKIIFVLATAAAAVAADLFVWGNSDPDHVAIAPPPEPAIETASPTPTPAEAEFLDAKEEAAPVEVAAVDFGSQSGSVFYVSGENAATAVVWVTGMSAGSVEPMPGGGL